MARRTPSLIGWWHEGTPDARKALVGAALGWMLDSFDVMLYALVLPSVIADLGLDNRTGGLLGSFTLLASAAGGLLFGIIADRHGRTKALMGSILLYSLFTGACGLAQNVVQLAVFRVLLGLGFGGQWASGATLVSETWPAEHRGKALGFVQSAWAVGYGAAALVDWVVRPLGGWRAVFFVGVLPALLVLWVQANLKEPEAWRSLQRTGQPRGRFRDLFRPPLGGLTIMVTLMNALTMFAWWGFNLWIPSYLVSPRSRGGVGLDDSIRSLLIIVMQIGMWFGYVTFGYVSDRIGRKRSYVAYLLSAAVLVFLYTQTRVPLALLVLGPFVAFFGTGYFSGFGAVTAEIYDTKIRGTAQGFTYNVGRIASAVAPFYVGQIADSSGFGVALSMTSIAFLLAAVSWVGIPETRGRLIQPVRAS